MKPLFWMVIGWTIGRIIEYGITDEMVFIAGLIGTVMTAIRVIGAIYTMDKLAHTLGIDDSFKNKAWLWLATHWPAFRHHSAGHTGPTPLCEDCKTPAL